MAKISIGIFLVVDNSDAEQQIVTTKDQQTAETRQNHNTITGSTTLPASIISQISCNFKMNIACPYLL